VPVGAIHHLHGDIAGIITIVQYEVGFAEGLGRLIFATASEGTKLPFDIVDTPVTFWNSLDELRIRLHYGGAVAPVRRVDHEETKKLDGRMLQTLDQEKQMDRASKGEL
jgi:hypothetical protein